MKNILFVVLFASSASVYAAGATFVVGNTIKDDLKVKGSISMGYVAAIADVMSSSPVNGFKACIPQRVQIGQLRDVVAKFFESNPEILHHQADGLVAAALSNAFPCR